jgi:TorA-specific chaperone
MNDRVLAYTFLAAAYRSELTQEFLQALQTNPLPTEEGVLSDFFATLKDADLEQLRVDLAAEYAALFLNMSPHPVPPYESVYTSDLHLLMQEAHRLVLAEYACAGFRKDERFKDPDDHIAVEFEFMAALAERSCAAFDAGATSEAHELLEWQCRFFEEHIQNWVYRFCDDLERQAHTTFYRGLASLTRNCLDQERKFFKAEARASQ